MSQEFRRNPSRRVAASPVRIVRGTFAYYAGTSGTVVVDGAVQMWSAAAGTVVDATVTIDGGPTITIPTGESFTSQPEGTLEDPTFIFTTTATYYIEVVR